MKIKGCGLDVQGIGKSDCVWVLEELLRMMCRGANNMKPELGQQRRVSDVSGKIVRFVRN